MIDFFNILKSKNEPMYYVGWLCLVAAIGCFVLTKTTETQVWGVNAWFKPFKFLLSTTIFLWSMGWYLQYFDKAPSVIWYSWGMILLLNFENVYIVYQASRGEISHFNLSTPFKATMFSLMAFAAAGISFWTAFIGLQFFSNKVADLPDSYLWGIRLGILIFFIFSLQGFAMGARLSHTVGGADGSEGLPVVNWSKKYGDLRIAHFLGMHALQIIPWLSFYVLKNALLVALVAVIYALITAAIFIQALQGKPLIR
jgi:hypothetical protein